MAVASTNTPAPIRKSGFLKALSQQLASYGVYRRTYRELNALSDRELDDIGISRYDIRQIALRSAALD